jgi:hypothetical protein
MEAARLHLVGMGNWAHPGQPGELGPVHLRALAGTKSCAPPEPPVLNPEAALTGGRVSFVAAGVDTLGRAETYEAHTAPGVPSL